MIEYTITPTDYDRENGILSYKIIPIVDGYDTLEMNLPLAPAVIDAILAMNTVEEKKTRLREEIIKMDDSYQKQWETKAKNASADFSDLELLIGVPGTTVVNEPEVTRVLGVNSQRLVMSVPPVIV